MQNLLTSYRDVEVAKYNIVRQSGKNVLTHCHLDVWQRWACRNVKSIILLHDAQMSQVYIFF